MSGAPVYAASILLFFACRAVRFSLFRVAKLRCYFGYLISIKRLKYLRFARLLAVIQVP
jgi:hypothetical protein